jgi:colanic acid/amylovoran biosynthesis protein
MKNLTTSQRERRLRVGLLWHSLNSDNLGVTALTFSQIALIEAAADANQLTVDFDTLQWKDSGPPQISRSNIKMRMFTSKQILSPGGLYANVRNCDLVLDISAGDSFADIYGVKRFTYNATAKAIVLLSGKPLVLSPQTIGPFKRWWARFAAKYFMRKVKAVFSRDTLSTDYAKSLGISKVIEACDVAFALPWSPCTLPPSQRIRVGINVSGLLYSGGYSKNNAFALKSDYPTLIRRLLRTLLSQEDVEIHLISHVISETMAVEDDYAISKTLASEFPDVIVAPKFTDPMSAKSYISGMDFFCGARMHACIAAFSSGVPVIPMAYSRKFSGLFGSLGYNHVADCVTMTEDQIIEMVMNGYSERITLKKKVEVGNDLALKKLGIYQNFLEETIRSLVRDRGRS